MKIWWSASEGGFFHEGVQDADKLPSDLVEISEEEYRRIWSGQGGSVVISSDESGYPILVEAPPPSAEVLVRQALARRDELLSVAALRIAPLQDAVDLDDATDADVALLKKWKQYRVSLNRITDQEGFPEEIGWPVPPDQSK